MKRNILLSMFLFVVISLPVQAFMNPPQVIKADDENYQAQDTRKFEGISSLAVSPKGRLWVVWYAGPTPGEDKNNYVVVATSGDDGKSWKELFIIDPDGPGEVRAFDPEVWLDPQGRVWVFWAQHPASDRLNAFSGTWAMVTENPDDEDAVWSAPRRLTDGIMMCKPTVLSSGRWLLPTSTWRATDFSARAVASDDNGKTFEVVGSCNILPVEERMFDEHMFVERKDGSIWMLVRTKYGIGESFSTDQGKTWSDFTPSSIQHPSARFFIRRLNSGNLLLVKHGKIDEKIGRSHLMAFVSTDDGKTWHGGLLLDDKSGISYPDGQETVDGTIYITYDYSRTGQRVIYMAAFTEADALAGEAVSDKVRLGVEISRGSDSVGLDNKDGQPLQKEPAGALSVAEAAANPLQAGQTIFSDRKYITNKIPAALDGAKFLTVGIDGVKTARCTRAGVVYFLTPQPQRNKDSRTAELEKLGFKKVDLPEFGLFDPAVESNFCTLYQKSCKEGETITFGKWAVPVFFDELSSPVIKGAAGLFDEANKETLGLERLPIEKTRVYEATQDNWKFSHTSNLIVFKNKLHLMWSNGVVDEDTAGQRILHSTSSDGVKWSTPVPLMTPDMMSDNESGALMSSGWHVHGNTLLAYATWSQSAKFADYSQTMLWAVSSSDGKKWSKPQSVVPGTYLEGPRATPSGTWLLLGQGDAHQPIFFYSTNPDGLNGWTQAAIDIKTETTWPEPSCFVRPDGSVVTLIRSTKKQGRLWASESVDGGRSWINTGTTNLTDAWARTSAGNLPDGTCFIVSNPSTKIGRDILAIALSDDGITFDRAKLLLNNAPPLEFAGKAKGAGWQYPSAKVWEQYLYIAYTVGKEHVEVLRVKLSDLKK